MRYEKKVILLSSILAALLLIWGAGILFSPERVAARSESAHLISGKPADVASIAFKAEGGQAILLAKSGSSWTLSDGQAQLPVQAERVKSFLDDLGAISRLRVVARSKDSWSGFDLDEAKAKRATLKDASGKVLSDVYVGGNGPTGSETYLRRAGSDLSYSAETGISSYFTSARSSWLDLKLLSAIKEADVQSLSIKSSAVLEKGKPALALDYSLRREGQQWKSGAAAIDGEAVSSLLRSILGLQGEDYAASPPADAFAKVQARVSLELGNGAAKVIEVGSAIGADRFYARVPGTGLVLELSTYSLKSLLKSQADLAAKK
jgi:hypothetical protein